MVNIIVKYNEDRNTILSGESWTYTDSLNLAKVLNTDHYEVLKKIRKVLKDYKIEDSELKSESSNVNELTEYINKHTDFTYAESFYKNKQNKLQPFYKLSKDLLVLVIFSFRKLENAHDLQKAYIAKFNEMEKELNWWRARYLGIDVRNDLTDSIKEYLENPDWKTYFNFTDLVYTILFGKKCKRIRKDYKLKDKENVRKLLHEDSLNLVKGLENEISVLLKYGNKYKTIKLQIEKLHTVIFDLKMDEKKLSDYYIKHNIM
ncbi:Rha family transcriptional regulator [Niallia alba]|uniref:Rha family transcriptional regulator n=1 Tax=Niallia alba TaxID=2729105 RepID=UPI002E1CBBFA|nr:Rha family transcriptional regulator [Niallia alba]